MEESRGCQASCAVRLTSPDSASVSGAVARTTAEPAAVTAIPPGLREGAFEGSSFLGVAFQGPAKSFLSSDMAAD